MQKRSLTIAGHPTSMALEPEFWGALESMAADRNTTTARLIAEIDETRASANLSSAVRVAVLNWYMAKSQPPS